MPIGNSVNEVSSTLYIVQKDVHSVGPYELYNFILGYVSNNFFTWGIEILSPPVKICLIFSNTFMWLLTIWLNNTDVIHIILIWLLSI